MSNNIVYFDNGATTWPKPVCIKESVDNFFNEFTGSPKRSHISNDIVEKIRIQSSEYFDAENTLFVPSATIAINIILNSLLNKNDHVVTTNIEHHAVYRTLEHLRKEKGIQYDIVDYYDNNQQQNIQKILKAITDKTKMIVVNHASNVTGVISNILTIRNSINRKILLVVDVSQTCGLEEISLREMGADIIFASTHKHLYGIPGLGFICFNGNLEFKSFICGGTGKKSFLMEQPSTIPEIVEVGTVNTPALLAFQAALKFCSTSQRKKMRQHALYLKEQFISNCSDIPNIQIYLNPDTHTTNCMIPINIKNLDPNFVVAPYLSKKGIVIRSGLHCAPLIHKTIGTYPRGLVRISTSIFNTCDEIKFLTQQLLQLDKKDENAIYI